MPEQQRKPLAQILIERAGYTSDAEARKRAEKREEAAEARKREEIFLELLSKPVNPLESVVPAWEAHQKYGKQTDELGRLAMLAWKPISDLISLLRRMDIELVGFDRRDGPKTLSYDPDLQKTIYRENVEDNGTTTIVDNPPWRSGDLVRVVVPGIIDKKTGIYYRYPIVDHVIV